MTHDAQTQALLAEINGPRPSFFVILRLHAQTLAVLRARARKAGHDVTREAEILLDEFSRQDRLMRRRRGQRA